MVAVENVFYCRACTLATLEVSDGPVQCEECKAEMIQIGWFETDDKGTKEQKDRAGDE